MKKPAAAGPTPEEKAKRSLGQKLNRPSKPPPPLPEMMRDQRAKNSAPKNDE